MSKQVIDNGIVREWWNDLATTQADGTATPIPARSVRFYTAAGAVQSTRALTAAEAAEFDAWAAQDVQQGNESTVRAQQLADFTAMQTIKADTNANINSNPAARIKDIAVAVRRMLRRDLGIFDGTD